MCLATHKTVIILSMEADLMYPMEGRLRAMPFDWASTFSCCKFSRFLCSERRCVLLSFRTFTFTRCASLPTLLLYNQSARRRQYVHDLRVHPLAVYLLNRKDARLTFGGVCGTLQ